MRTYARVVPACARGWSYIVCLSKAEQPSPSGLGYPHAQLLRLSRLELERLDQLILHPNLLKCRQRVDTLLSAPSVGQFELGRSVDRSFGACQQRTLTDYDKFEVPFFFKDSDETRPWVPSGQPRPLAF